MITDYNIFTEDFQADDIAVIDVSKETINGETFIVLHAVQKMPDILSCPNCGSVSIYKKGNYVRTITYLEAFGYPSFISLKQQRFVCRDCKKTFNLDNSIVTKNGTISNNVKRKALFELQTKQSITDVSERLRVSITTILNEFDDNIFVPRKQLPEVICIDEFKANTDKGKMACIIGNPVTGDIIDILPNCDLAYLLWYFNQISADECLNVKYCIFDLHEGYRRACRSHFKNATLIADRFHWIRITVQAFNIIRIEIMKEYLSKSSSTKDLDEAHEYQMHYEVLKNGWKLFLANRSKKDDVFFVKDYSKKVNDTIMTVQDVLEFALNCNERLNNAYNVLQDLYKLSVYSSYETFNNDINEWFEKAEETHEYQFKKVINTYKSWKKEIRASFIINPVTKKRMTNGFIEGKNNYNKVIKRIAFGYKSFDKIRNRIMYVNSYILNLLHKK